MDLRHLRYFIVVAEELNFHRAAERIHIDQTPLARTIRNLEDQLGVSLFARSPRRLSLTPAGEKLLEQARMLFVRLERAKRVVRETDARHREPLRIGVADGLAQPRLSECLNRWRAVAPDTPLELRELRADKLMTALRSEEVDAGFSFGAMEDEIVMQQPAWTHPLVALLPSGHELTRREKLSIRELFVFPAIVCHPVCQSGLRRQMDVVRREYALAPVIADEARTLAGYVVRVAAGLGVGVADAGHMQALRHPDVVVLPIVEDIRLTTYVLHKRQRDDSRGALRRFLALAKALDS